MRLSEVAQLRIENIKTENGIWYFDVTDDHPGQSLKTDSSHRRLPIHQELIKAGFLIFVEKQKNRKNGDGWLFTELLARDRHNTRINTLSKFINNTLIRKVLGKDDPKLDSRSFRHTFKTSLRRLGYSNDEVTYTLLGHDNPNVGDNYGEHPIESLNEVLQNVVVPGGSLAHFSGYDSDRE